MKRRRAEPLKLLAEVAVVAAYGLSKSCLSKMKNKGINTANSEKQFQRKMTVLASIYHFIGIFYNE